MKFKLQFRAVNVVRYIVKFKHLVAYKDCLFAYPTALDGHKCHVSLSLFYVTRDPTYRYQQYLQHRIDKTIPVKKLDSNALLNIQSNLTQKLSAISYIQTVNLMK